MDVTAGYPGQRLGLPEAGRGAVDSWPRRILALLLDWMASRLVATVFFGGEVWTRNGPEQLAVFGVFILECAFLTALVGGSFGQLALRMAVVHPDGRPLSLFQALLRSLLVCLVVPPLVFNRDNRGLHDLAVDSVVVRR